MRDMAAGPRVLLRRLRELMAEPLEPQERLDKHRPRKSPQNMVAEVCSVYVLRADTVLELYATEGLNPRLGPPGLAQAWAKAWSARSRPSARPLNLPDAQKHPAFAYLPETGEEVYNSFLGVPVLRAGRTLGVLDVQNRDQAALPRRRGRGTGDHGDGDRRDDRHRRARRARPGRGSSLICAARRASPGCRSTRASASAMWCCTSRVSSSPS